MNDIIHFPIDQAEQAKQVEAKNLLPIDIYKKITSHLKTSLAKVPDASQPEDLDNCRVHDSILINGDRGTGKSSVLVNLETFLKEAEKTDNALKSAELLILKPVDPTLLDKGDDLLLNVIVAAIIRNKSVESALEKQEHLAEKFYDKLENLGLALEGVHNADNKYGLDRLRSFLGNHGLAQAVHELFAATLSLTGKKIIVLPIDDVDTSLQHAFENMEVVRKYLASPFIIPIISGDLSLYHEVTWRDFYKRLANEINIDSGSINNKAQSLSHEYQRKILPLPRRMNMPAVHQHINSNVILTQHGKEILPLSEYYFWIDAIINERINGLNDSKIRLEINSTRALAQIINHTKSEILNLPSELSSTKEKSSTLIKRMIIQGDIKKETVLKWQKSLLEFFRYKKGSEKLTLSLDCNISTNECDCNLPYWSGKADFIYSTSYDFKNLKMKIHFINNI